MKHLKHVFTFCLALQMLSACKKDDPLNGDIPLGGRLGVVTTDTITVVAVSLAGDSFPSANLTSNYLGVIYDPIYGKSRNSFFSQFNLTNSVSFADSTVPDSAVLFLKEKSIYGDSTTLQQVKVFEVTKNLPSTAYSTINESGYYNSANVLADHTFDPKKFNSANTFLRIPVPAVATKIMSGTSNDFLTDISFREFFKGLFVQTVDQSLTAGKGAAISFDLGQSKLVFYYHEVTPDTGGTWKTTKREITFPGADVLHINQTLHTRTPSAFSSNAGLPGQDSLFVMGQGGQMVKITFPHLAKLKALNPRGNITVNKADLKMVQLVQQFPYFTEAKEISAYRLTSTGHGGDAIIGAIRSGTNDYTMNISSYIQEAINGTAEKGVIIKLTNESNSPQRLILMGEKNIKLVLTLTKL